MSRWSWGYEEPLSQDHRNCLLTSGAPPYPSPKQLTKCILIHVMESIHVLQAGTNTHPRNHFVNLETLEALESDISSMSIKVRLCAQCMMIISSTLFSSTPVLHSKFFFCASLCIPALVYSANYTFFCGIIRLLWSEGFSTSVSPDSTIYLISWWNGR